MYSWQNHKPNKRKHIYWALAGLTLLFIFLLPNSLALAAEQVTVTIPTFDVTLNGRAMDGTYSKYPLIVYKDITYFPMTYYDSRLLGIQADWSEEDGLTVTKQDGYFYEYMREINEQKNKSRLTAKIADGKITVNDKAIDNSQEEYPLLVCRDVTYFPLTWRFAAEEFGWEYDFTPEKGLVITNSGVKQEDPNEYEWRIGVDGSGAGGSMRGIDNLIFPISFIGAQQTYTLRADGEYYYKSLAALHLAIYNHRSGCDAIIKPMEQWEYQVYRLIGERQELLYWRKVPFYSGRLSPKNFATIFIDDIPLWSSDSIKAGEYLIQMQHPEEIIYEDIATHTINHTTIKSGEPVLAYSGFQLSAPVTIIEKPIPED